METSKEETPADQFERRAQTPGLIGRGPSHLGGEIPRRAVSAIQLGGAIVSRDPGGTVASGIGSFSLLPQPTSQARRTSSPNDVTMRNPRLACGRRQGTASVRIHPAPSITSTTPSHFGMYPDLTTSNPRI